MPKFNPKNMKYNKKSAITLDSKHQEMVTCFSNEEKTIQYLKNQIYVLKNKLNTQPKLSIEEKMDIQDQILEMKQEIKTYKEKKNKYFLDNSKYIFEYFENKKNISSSSGNVCKSKIINQFFKINETKAEEDTSSQNQIQTQNIVLKYLSNISDEFLDMNHFIYQTDVCQSCHKGELIPLEEDGVLLCNACYKTIPYLIENEKSSYKDPPKEVCFYAYKRINHFKEILAQFQGKETTLIPEYVIENIRFQIKKERITLDELTNIKTKEILKKLELSKYYEHIPFIKDKLGIKPPIMSPDLEETLCNLFSDLQTPYSKFCPDDRVNFLNYYYTLYKLCELLGETSYLTQLPMLKDPEKRNEQDVIWKKICKELNWEFIPTL
jgi:hypothetical protein